MMTSAAERVVARSTGESAILLLDDFSSEMDGATRTRLVEVLGTYDHQILLTGLERDPSLSAWPRTSRWFHVEHSGLASTASLLPYNGTSSPRPPQ